VDPVDLGRNKINKDLELLKLFVLKVAAIDCNLVVDPLLAGAEKLRAQLEEASS
jgi:hypothetical protein